MTTNRPTVLILASDPAFSREIKANWPQEPTPHGDSPEFVVLDEGFSRDLKGSNFDLAIADASSVDRISSSAENSGPKKSKTDLDLPGSASHQRLNKRLNKQLRHSLAAAGKPAIVIHTDPSLDFYNIQGPVIDLRRESELWPAITGLLGREILRRVDAESRAREAERLGAAAQAEAALGRYMIEMRSNINNALTTVLGNAELLVYEAGMSATVQIQADAIRNMALRLHEVFQRFSSLEKELNVAAREPSKAHAAAAGR
jgi:hypothetical protein